jgi:hypothetical protein
MPSKTKKWGKITRKTGLKDENSSLGTFSWDFY